MVEFAEKTRFICSPHCPQVERFHAEILHTRFPAHAHEGFVVGIVHRGAQQFMYRGANHHAVAGSITLMNPDEIHTAQAGSEDGVGYQTLHVPSSLIETVAGPRFRFKLPQLAAPGQAHRLELGLAMLDATVDAAFWHERLSAILVNLVQWLAPGDMTVPALSDARFESLLEYIEANVTLPLNLSTLAEQAAMSQYHLIRSFKKLLGVTPHVYVQARRTALAKRMLRSQSPADVAVLAGFVDQSHLTRWLKACYGTTPGVYRKQFRADEQNVIGARRRVGMPGGGVPGRREKAE